MNHVESEIAGAHNAHNRVQVCAIAIDQAARIVDDLIDFPHIFFKQTECVGVGEHDAGSLVGDLGAQVIQVHIAARIRFHLDDFVSRHGAGRGIRAVRRIGNQHLAAFGIAACQMIGANDQNAGRVPLAHLRRAGGSLRANR